MMELHYVGEGIFESGQRKMMKIVTYHEYGNTFSLFFVNSTDPSHEDEFGVMIDWIDENTTGHHEITWVSRYQLHSYDKLDFAGKQVISCRSLVFDDPNDAMLFKLTWS